ncbi:MAG: cryptochrome/photolyase family protein [Candidatus Sericytochromatia bacterium]
MPPVIVWFRQDLRLHDNPALQAACAAGRVIPVYILDPATAPLLGGASRVWLHFSLQSLAAQLEALGSRLILRRGSAQAVLDGLVAETQAKGVFWNRCYEPEVIARDTQIKQALSQRGVQAESHKGSLLFEPWEIKTQTGGPYRVFTPFWKACLKQARDFQPLPAPAALPAVLDCASDSLDDWALLPQISWDDGIRQFWGLESQAGENAAQQALQGFLTQNVADYAERRNLPAQDGTSRLSPYLHFGEISPTQIWAAAQRVSAGEGRRVFLSEIGWREFAYHILYHYPETVAAPMDARFQAFPWATDPAGLRAWQRGLTGYPIVDAGMRQLWATGWMHNRVRMIVASFLTKDLLIHWREGADWFWDTLVDADLASNSMGWQWTAGSGADAAPFFRIFNPITQGQKFDPEGRYLREWLPELTRLPDKWLHQPWAASDKTLAEAGVRLGHDYPLPIVDHAAARERALTAFAQIKTAQGQNSKP